MKKLLSNITLPNKKNMKRIGIIVGGIVLFFGCIASFLIMF